MKGSDRVELARMTSKGQLTIPVAIRRLLGVDTGDQLLFYEKDGQVIIANASPSALQDAQIAAAKAHVYSLDEIRKIAVPICVRYKVDSMRLFGSYARGEATKESDLDFVIGRGEITSLMQLGGLQAALEDAFRKKVDLLTDDSLEPSFSDSIKADEVIVYDIGRAR